MKYFRKGSRKAGLPPGTVMHIGERKSETVKISIIDYNDEQIKEKLLEKADDCFPFKDTQTVTWINIDSIHDVDIIEKLGKHFGIHPLVLEDIANTEQRPKMENFDDYIFVIAKMIYQTEMDERVVSEQVSFILCKNTVITFQEREGDVFEIIRERLRNNKGRIRRMGADYLVYALIDTIVDGYFTIMEGIGEKVESVEEELIKKPAPDTLQNIHHMKREMITLRKSVWPLREVINTMQRDESPLIAESTNIYLRDVYDHTIQVIDTIESLRDMVSGMLDIYLSSISNKMNEVMKVLTIIATIFIPLTFIAGIYGMNFQFMPELVWRWGYPIVLGIMLIVAIAMLIFFRRKRWI